MIQTDEPCPICGVLLHIDLNVVNRTYCLSSHATEPSIPIAKIVEVLVGIRLKSLGVTENSTYNMIEYGRQYCTEEIAALLGLIAEVDAAVDKLKGEANGNN